MWLDRIDATIKVAFFSLGSQLVRAAIEFGDWYAYPLWFGFGLSSLAAFHLGRCDWPALFGRKKRTHA
jgi:hypothetical protein